MNNERRYARGGIILATFVASQLGGRPVFAQEAPQVITPQVAQAPQTDQSVSSGISNPYPRINEEPIPQTPDGVDAVTRWSYYPIHGQTIQDLATQMRALGPLESAEGGHFFAAVVHDLIYKDEKGQEQRTMYTLDFDPEKDRGSCRIISATVHTASTIYFPRWIEESGASPEIQDRWENFLKALRNHEWGHILNRNTIGAKIRSRVLSLGGNSSCDDLRQVAISAANETASELKALDDGLDAQTDHGMKQGANIDLYLP